MTPTNTTPPDHTDLSELREKLADLVTDYYAFKELEKNKLTITFDPLEAVVNDLEKLFKQYAQPPVVADEELDSILAFGYDDPAFIHDIHVLIGGEDKVEAAKAALLQREQRLVAEARIDEHMEWVLPQTDHAHQWEQDGEGSGIQYFDNKRLDRLDILDSQLRHNTNTGKG